MSEPVAGIRRWVRPGGRGRVAVALAVAAALVAGAGWVGSTSGWWGGRGGDAQASNPTGAGPAVTTEVTRQTLTQSREEEGTLGHGDAFTLTAAGAGTITGIAGQGDSVERGMTLYRLNERPVTAMYGPVPMYRELRPGDTGRDVEQLESNLAELGYDGFTVDDALTAATAAAIRSWQADLGLPETGIVQQSDVVFVPVGGRVDTIHTGVGGVASPGAPVLDLTGSDHVVSLEVELRDRELLAVDTEVTVRLPGGEAVAGVVTGADVVAAGDSEATGSADTIVEVRVTLAEPADESMLGAPVDVVVDIDERADVLTVPVNALLARTGGGHGLEVVAADGTVSLVPVETGMFAQGRVEVAGDGIEEGTVVGVAGR